MYGCNRREAVGCWIPELPVVRAPSLSRDLLRGLVMEGRDPANSALETLPLGWEGGRGARDGFPIGVENDGGAEGKPVA